MTITAQLADGRTLEFPDGTDPAVIQTAVKRLVGGGAPAPNPLEGMPGYQRALVGSGAEFSDMGRGVRQAITRPLNKAGVLISDADMAAIDKSDADAKERDAPLANDFGANVGRFTTLAATAFLPTQTVKGAMALGSALGALAPADSEVGRLVNVLVSGGLGGVGQALGAKLAAWMQGGKKGVPSISAEELSILREMERRGYPLRPAQVSGSKSALAAETQLASLPGSAGKMAANVDEQRALFNRDVMGTMGERPGATVDDIKTNFGTKYDAATKGVNLTQDTKLIDDLVDVQTKYARNLSPDQRAIVQQYIDDIPPAFDGQVYQTWRSRIGARASSTNDSELKAALKGIQGALDATFDRQAPKAARGAMERTRGEYRNFKDLSPLLRQAEAEGSDISAKRVANRVAQSGNLSGELAEVGRIGQMVAKSGPNSGTSQNQHMRALLTGGLPLVGAGGGFMAGGDPTSAMLGGAGTLAATLLAPNVAARVYLSKALRDSSMKGAGKAVAKSKAPTTALARALRQIGTDEELLIESLVRGGGLGLPALAGGE